MVVNETLIKCMVGLYTRYINTRKIADITNNFLVLPIEDIRIVAYAHDISVSCLLCDVHLLEDVFNITAHKIGLHFDIKRTKEVYNCIRFSYKVYAAGPIVVEGNADLLRLLDI